MLKTIAVPQPGSGKALHQAIEISDDTAVETTAIGFNRVERLADLLSQSAVFSLLEALGKARKTLRGLLELGHIDDRPFGLLQTLPRLQNLACLVNDPLGKVMLQAISARVFGLGHIQTTVVLLSDTADGAMLAPPLQQNSVVSHLFDNNLMAHSQYAKSIDA